VPIRSGSATLNLDVKDLDCGDLSDSDIEDNELKRGAEVRREVECKSIEKCMSACFRQRVQAEVPLSGSLPRYALVFPLSWFFSLGEYIPFAWQVRAHCYSSSPAIRTWTYYVLVVQRSHHRFWRNQVRLRAV
jgi:hypothetical protein